MTLGAPIWLVLVMPLAICLYLWRLPSRALTVLRVLALVLILAAMCAPSVWLPSRAGTVVVVADRSLSMPPEAKTAQEEAIGIIQSKMSSGDDMAVISFARGAFVEQPPQRGAFAGFVGRVGPDASNLAEALDVALSLIQRGSPGRIVVISDGRFTGADPASAAAGAAARDVAID